MNSIEKMLYLSSKLMMLNVDKAHNHTEIVKVSNELATLQKQVEQRSAKHYEHGFNEQEGYVKFTKKEILQMPDRFRKTFYLAGYLARAYKRKSGKHGINYELKFRREGYNIYASSNDLKVAKQKFIKAANTAEQKKEMPGVPTTFHEFSMYYFENFRKRKVGKQTYRVDLSRYKIHIQPHFGTIELRNILPAQCQELIDKVLSSGFERTAQDIFSLLNGIFKMAIAHNVLDRNPLAVILPVTHEREHGKALTKLEERELLEASAGTPYQLMFAVALFTGLRPNEYSTARIEGEFIIAVNSKRKTKKVEYKKIPITPMLKPYLVGVTELKFFIVECIREKLRSILPNHKLYDLRTTFYTRCQECGVADVARMEFVGHSLGKLGNTYTDLSDNFLYNEGLKLNY